LKDGKVESYWALGELKPVDGTPGPMATELRQRLAESVQRCIAGDCVGAWLSGGLDSSTMAALARPNVHKLHTFAGGLADSPDIDHAREAAQFIGCEHHEVIVTFEQMLEVLPDVILHLESFDALLVRSSIVNYLVGKAASDFVGEVFSGEGGDELFAGYEYLGTVPRDRLHEELLDITGRLHNTALQRVDRCACSHGLVAHVPFLDPEVFHCALRIPVEYKGINGVEKWILRQAMAGALPDRVLNRRKSKFWEGSGVGARLADHAEQRVSDADFARERQLPNGWRINSKEELMHYRIFKEHFGQLTDLSWMGRTKGAPVT
jgi:asparagine synthase (glutamine-hydrolysing)